MIALIILAVVVLAVLYLPGLWVRHVMAKYSTPADRYPGTGAELARHLLRRAQLDEVAVEMTDPGADHYDPEARAVRLSPDNYRGRSLTAVTVAAHEVGHALQHASGYPPFKARGHLVRLAAGGQRLGAIMMFAIPVVTLLVRMPAPGLLLFLAGMLSMGLAAVVHLVTLPTEWDASFGRALPMLERGRYLKPVDYPHARRILTAAALTYVAQSLMSLLNIWAWLRMLRR
ncbi:zinc metallopeptidase [Alkalilimnicola ehrlichii MLHE-1]|uniref:Peptidase, membrane zinc metallopeptidase, putative n=1 Tax=Alkalilimnicola ehrlichii (strain ATCC BAA-1101 / DSM 17681 / MLHE-1) TaxID=187272 RepID=Q0A7M5_ALKEH|nr:zinc metallopeptidase [Alkalilimnicola ehrlichii]ABI57162.1 peptidase, membrane zinc metallopeptidase, putative [Alkalilimnicola ehrlichii MLHE-1]